jgi:hypothetical protein
MTLTINAIDPTEVAATVAAALAQPSEPSAPDVAAPAEDTIGGPRLELTAAAIGELRDLTRARWQGWLAPLGERAGDLRTGLPVPTGGRLKTREMPLPFFWQKETSHGGQIINGAVEIGALTYADIRPRADRGDRPWIWGTGFIDLNDPDGMYYARRLDERMSRWISVRLDFDPTFEPPADLVTPRKGEQERRISPTDHPDWWRLMNATAESQPAFDGAEISLIDDFDDFEDCEDPEAPDGPRPGVGDGDQPGAGTDPGDLDRVLQLVSSGTEVNPMSDSTMSTTMQLPPTGAEIKPPETPGPASGGSGPDDVSGGNAGDHGCGDAALVAVVTGDTTLPIADRDTAWKGPEATARLIEWAGGRFKLDPAKMAKVFLYRDSNVSPKMVTAWKFPFADVIGGQVKIVPRAVFTAAAVLRGSMGGTKIPKSDQNAMRGKIKTLYGRMATQFKDPKIRAPFDAVVSDAHAAAMRTGDKAPGAQPPWRRPRDRKRERRGLPRLTASATSWAAEVASRVPDEPPEEWFTDPCLTKACKIRVSSEGRVFGHVAAWDTEHAAFPGVHPPRNRDKTYSKFHRHPVRVAGGGIVKTGPLATGGHTTTDIALAIESVQAHYDDPRYVVADVVAGEDEWGIWVSGALRPGVSPFQVMLADRYSFSGDWRYGELLAACSVSVPGFHLDAHEEVGALTAAAAGAGVCDLPVVAEAAPAIIADASGVPAVLIAAGVVLEDEIYDHDGGADFSAVVDALSPWLQEQMAALRAEFGMSETTTTPTTEQVIDQLKDMFTKEVNVLREEMGLPQAVDGSPETPGTETPQPTQDTPAPQQPAPGEQPAVPAEAPAAPAEQPTTDTTTAAAAPQVQQLQQWLSGKFASLRADHAAKTSAAVSAEFTAQRQALLDDVHADERSHLFALVHGEVA